MQDPDLVDNLLPPRADQPVDRARHPASRRLGWRVALRSLVLVQLAIVLFFGYVGQRIYSFRQQQAIVVQFSDREHCFFVAERARPMWFWTRLGTFAETEPSDVVRVWVGDAPLTLREAEDFLKFRNLRDLTLQRGITEPAAGRFLAQMPVLERLDLRDVERMHLDDATLATLAASSSLKRLTIESVNVTDEGIAKLADMPNLQLLDIHYARLTIAGLRPWIEKNRLPHLSLVVRSRFADEELRELSEFTSLESLSMYELTTEVAVRHLANLPNLQRLSIEGNLPLGIREYAASTLPERVCLCLHGQELSRTRRHVLEGQ